MTYAVCSDSCCGEYEALEERLVYMTMLAHKQALFDRIKQKIEQEEGEKLDRLAGLLVEASRKARKGAKDSEKLMEDLKDGIVEVFGE